MFARVSWLLRVRVVVVVVVVLLLLSASVECSEPVVVDVYASMS